MGIQESKQSRSSVLIEGTSTSTFSPIYRHPSAHSTQILPKIWGHSSYFNLFQSMAVKYENRPWLGHKFGADFIWLTYSKANQYITQLICALHTWDIRSNSLGLKLIGIMSTPREEWILTDLACMGSGIATIGLLDTEPTSLIISKFKQLHLKYLFVNKQGLAKVLNILTIDKTIALDFVVCFDPIKESDAKNAIELKLNLIQFNEFKSRVASFLQKREIDADEVCMLAYTAGTTDYPKLVRFTHEELMRNFTSILYENFDVKEQDVYVLFTNLALFGEKLLTYCLSIYGIKIGILKDFKSEINLVKPTLMLIVPRVMDYVQYSIKHELAGKSGLSGSIFNKCYRSCLKELEKNGRVKPSLWRNLVFSSIREKFGKRLRYLLTGASLPNSDSMKFIQICLGCPVIEAYGLLECGYSNLFGNMSLGPLGNCELKLRFTPEYTFEGLNPKKYGELYIKNNCSSNWFATGDLFKIHDSGHFQDSFAFLDRISYVFTTKSGFTVAPQRLENIYRENPYVSQVLIYGNQRINGVIAVAVVDYEYFKNKWTDALSAQEVVESEMVVGELLKEFKEISRRKDLKVYEEILDAVVDTVPWTGLEFVTASMKLKRLEIIKKYQEQLDLVINRLDRD